MRKNILITGSNGFIGKNIKEYLENWEEKYNIYATNHNNLDLLKEESVDEFFKNNNVDIIIHCAISCEIDKNGNKINNNIVKSNLKMFFNLEKNLNKNMIMINCGSGAEYNKRRSLCKVKEENFGICIPDEDYGFSKYIISQHIMNSQKNIINLRIFGLYGKYENYKFKFISNSIVKNLLHLPIIINKNVVFDYLFIDDFINIVKKLIDSNVKNGVFNVTPKESIDLVSIVKIINRISSFKSNIILLNEGINNEYTACNEKLLKLMNNINFTSYYEGIKELYDFYKINEDELDYQEIKNDKYLMLVKSLK